MKNQCDGCMRGLLEVNGVHFDPESRMLDDREFGCTRSKYVEMTSAEAKELADGVDASDLGY